MSDDDFDTSASNSYDRRKIYAGASDKGGRDRIRLSLPSGTLAIAEELAATRKLDGIKRPYDMFRDSLAHRLHDYGEFLETTDSWMSQKCYQQYEKIVAESLIDERLSMRERDRKLMERCLTLIQFDGGRAVDDVRRAYDTMTTEEYRNQLSIMLKSWGS